MRIKARQDLDLIMSQVYDELRALATSRLQLERFGHTLQPTALVHEAYLRLANLNQIDWQSRKDVFRAGVAVMRCVLIDHARRRRAKKRNAAESSFSAPADRFSEETPAPSIDILALDEALEKLKKFDEQKAMIVELRYFGGQTIEEVSEMTGLSIATVKRHWKLAKAWLLRELEL